MRVRTLLVFATLTICFAAATEAQTPQTTPPPPTAAEQPPKQTQPQPPKQTPAPAPTLNPAEPSGKTNPSPETPKDPNAPITAEPIREGAASGEAEDQISDPNGQPAGGDYTGPSILSRGFNFARPSVPVQAKFRPFAGLNALYDSGLAGPYLGPNGKVGSATQTGIDGNFGIGGRRSQRKQIFDLDYRGHLYWYGGNSKYNGQDHALSAGYTRYVSSRLLVSLHENFGLYSNTYSVLNSTANTDLSTANVSVVVSPNTESFDTRTYFSSTEADAVYQKSARLSFNIGSSIFFVKRASVDLANATGIQARIDSGYRLTNRTTIGVYNAYTAYSFSHVYGNSDVHTVGADYSLAINRTTSLKLRAGGSRVEVLGLTSVTLDPVVAAILGQSMGVTKFYSVSYAPDFSGSLNKSFKRSSLGVSFAEGISPGNGLYLTSKHESESVYYGYSGVRRYSLGLSAGRDKLGSIGEVVGSYSSYFGRFDVGRTLPRHLHATVAFDYRSLGFSQSGYGRNEFRITAGVTYAPGEGPLKFW